MQKNLILTFCLGQMFTWILPPVPVGIAGGKFPSLVSQDELIPPRVTQGDVLDIQQNPPLLFHPLLSFRTLNTTEHFSECFHQPLTGAFRPPFSAPPA